MKNILRIVKENVKLISIVLTIGLVFGIIIGKISNQRINSSAQHQNDELTHQHINTSTNQTWTCSMHPQIKQNKPGLCPICAMDLIPVNSISSEGDNIDPNEIMMTESAAKLASIQTMKVTKGIPKKTLYLQGKVQADERNIAVLTARFAGRIEKLFVNFTGQNVKKGEKLATIYSPELVTTQRELLESISFKESRPSLYAAAKGKLKLWDLTDKQISTIEEKGEPQVYFDILSPITGTVTIRNVAVGDYLKEGTSLFKVVDLTKLWVMFDAYESDLPWIKLGDNVNFTIQALPGENFTAKVSFIDPFINRQTRIAKIRVNVPNSKMILKPEMFTTGILESKIAESSNKILIPKSSILWTGKRSVVYVKVPERESPSFIYREVILGPEAGTFYVIAKGLTEGEEIAVNGVFKIDASAQLAGKKSMMNPYADKISTAHDHSSMQLSKSDKQTERKTTEAGIKHEMFKVAGNCSMCKNRIEKTALSLKGVNSAEWSTETQILHISFIDNKVKLGAIHKAIAKVGHDTELEKAPDDVYTKLPACCLYERLENNTSEKLISGSEFFVNGTCGMCKDRIEKAALSINGVSNAEWNQESKMLNINFDTSKLNVMDIHKAVAKVGHDTKKIKADDKVYNTLPGCCLYERD